MLCSHNSPRVGYCLLATTNPLDNARLVSKEAHWTLKQRLPGYLLLEEANEGSLPFANVIASGF